MGVGVVPGVGVVCVCLVACMCACACVCVLLWCYNMTQTQVGMHTLGQGESYFELKESICFLISDHPKNMTNVLLNLRWSCLHV